MLKKLMVLALACGVSMSASASFVQYNLKGVTFNDGTSLSGFFVEDTGRNTIAFYDLTGPGNNYMSDRYTKLLGTSATVSGGPLSFNLSSTENMDFASTLALVFHAGATGDSFTVGGFEHTTWMFPVPGATVSEWQRNIVSGSVTAGTIDPGLLATLEAEAGANVPEPGSLALVAMGACALGGLRRRAARPALRRA